MRVLIAVTHLLGAGHLTRAAALARTFAGAGHEAVLVSGGVPAPMVRLDGVRLVQLPPLRIAGTDFGTLLGPDGVAADPDLLARRRALTIETVAAFAPDAVLTELFPFGRRALAGEFLALVEAARARPTASAGSGLRARHPGRLRRGRSGSRRPMHRVATLYDAVLVHGDPSLAPLDASWPLDPATAAKVRYTGYVDEGDRAGPAVARAGVLVAAGSGPAGLTLLRTAADAARRRPDLGWRILAGHGVPEPALTVIARGLPEGTVTRARSDYRALLAGAAVSVSQSGYNTVVDLLATGTPAVLVPFEAGGETEQRLRAERVAARGLARLLPEAELSGDTLLRAVDAQRAAPLPGPHGIDLGGARRSVTIVEALHAGRSAPGRAGRSGFDAVRRALDAAARERPVPFFWRDDDAVTATRALDRLIGLAEAHAVPLLLAAIPAGLEPALGRRIEGAGGVSVAIHGLAHRNHAPAGEKPAEFGAHRPLEALRADAAAGLPDRPGRVCRRRCSCRSSCRPGTGSRRRSRPPSRISAIAASRRFPARRSRASGGATPRSTRSTGAARAPCADPDALLRGPRGRYRGWADRGPADPSSGPRRGHLAFRGGPAFAPPRTSGGTTPRFSSPVRARRGGLRGADRLTLRFPRSRGARELAAVHPRPRGRVPHRDRTVRGVARPVPRRAARAHPGARRRVGIGQVGDRAGDPADPAAIRHHHQRADPVPGRRPRRPTSHDCPPRARRCGRSAGSASR